MANNTSTTRDTGNLRAPAGEHAVPPVDVYEDDTCFVLTADMPGVRPEGLDIHLENERLTIHGRVPPTAGASPALREFALRDYYRTFAVADVIDSERISARLRDGILRVELPKAPRAQARRIPIQVN